MSMTPPRAPVPPRFTRDGRGVLNVTLSGTPSAEDIAAIMAEVDKDLVALRPLSWWQRLKGWLR